VLTDLLGSGRAMLHDAVGGAREWDADHSVDLHLGLFPLPPSVGSWGALKLRAGCLSLSTLLSPFDEANLA